ncbi:MAG: molybdopterin molybdotransferase MoeA [Candidatus Caldarchaeum sp.]|nr:molybdopterin molybdotransferase MoeA [Candidatus Caldarchaeum sp.]
MKELRRIIKFTDIWEAQNILLAHVKPLDRHESVPVFEAADRVLYSPIVSQKDLPPHHASHMDGYAVKSANLQSATKENPVKLKIVGTCTPGKKQEIDLQDGEAARILTGAYLPDKADAVVPQEYVSVVGDYVVIDSPAVPWQFVDLKGFDVKAGQRLFERGHVLKMADAVLLASFGVERVDVVERPRVGLFAVGDELTESFDEARRGKVLNTHTHLVKRLISASGGTPTFYGIVPDDPAILKEKVDAYTAQTDVFISIAGSSISEKDVSSIFTASQSSSLFVHGLTLQPGRVGGFGFVNEKPFILLPGLIMSTLNVFMFLAYPLLRKLQHQPPRYYHHRVKARLVEDVRFRKYLDFVKIVWVTVEDDGRELTCRPIPGESSGVSIPSRSDGFVAAFPGVDRLEKGAVVWVNYPPGL